jgi:hypothetical protein
VEAKVLFEFAQYNSGFLPNLLEQFHPGLVLGQLRVAPPE